MAMWKVRARHLTSITIIIIIVINDIIRVHVCLGWFFQLVILVYAVREY